MQIRSRNVHDDTRRKVSAYQSVVRFIVGASGLALRGLGVAVVMGVVFGLLIGVGGFVMGVEAERLVMFGGFSGWVSGFIAMMFVFTQIRRNHHSGH